MSDVNSVASCQVPTPITPISGLAETAARERVAAAGLGHEAASEPKPANANAGSPADNLAKPAPGRRANEWSKAKDSFVSILDEAGAAIRVFDLEKRRILGLTHALSQIEQSFEALHGRFGDIEKKLTVFLGDRKRVDLRIDEAYAAIHGCEENEAELIRDNAALRSALSHAERRLAQHTDSIGTLSEENRLLRERLVAVERGGGLIVDEIARIRNELIGLNEARNAQADLSITPEQRPSDFADEPVAGSHDGVISPLALAWPVDDETPFAPPSRQAVSDFPSAGRAAVERRPADLRAELVRELRYRKSAEGALQVARSECLNLHRELASLRAKSGRMASEVASEPAAAPIHFGRVKI